MKTWEREDVYTAVDKYFEDMKLDLSQAQKSIDLQIYTFANDELGQSVVSELNNAARRGLKVRVLVDGFGTSVYDLQYLSETLDPRIRFKIYHPVPWAWPLLKTIGEFFKYLFRVNRRNHRKTCIIDRTIAWVGSMNISVQHLRWRDNGARVLGQKIKRLTHGFSQDLVRRIEAAENRVWITNAYFIPTPKLVRALCHAARRGVEVKIVVPKNCDVFFIPWVRALFYKELIESGVRFFEYLPTMLHAKTLIVDKWVIIGSSNMNHRSLNLDLEADIVLSHTLSRRKLEIQFLKDLKNSLEVTVEDLKKRSWIANSSGQALLLLKSWM